MSSQLQRTAAESFLGRRRSFIAVLGLVALLPVGFVQAEEAPTPKRLQEKIDRIIIPLIAVEDAAVKDVVAFLRKRSVELDELEADPRKKGVNIILLPDPKWEAVRLTLELKEIPLKEALRYVAELSGAEFRVDPNAVVLSMKK